MRAIAIDEFGGRERLALMNLPKLDTGQLAVHLEDVLTPEEGAQAHEASKRGTPSARWCSGSTEP